MGTSPMLELFADPEVAQEFRCTLTNKELMYTRIYVPKVHKTAVDVDDFMNFLFSVLNIYEVK